MSVGLGKTDVIGSSGSQDGWQLASADYTIRRISALDKGNDPSTMHMYFV